MKETCYLILCTLTIFCSCGEDKRQEDINKFSNNELRRIYQFCDERKPDSLVTYFTNSLSVFRAEAALAFASVQDPTYLPQLEKLLEDESPLVRTNAAYAIGQVGSISSPGNLIVLYGRESDDNCRVAMLEAMGKIQAKMLTDNPITGTSMPGNYPLAEGGVPPIDDDPAFIRYLAKFTFDSDAERTGWAKAVFWIHNAGYLNPRLMNKMTYALQAPGNEFRLACAYAMARFKGQWFEAPKNQEYIFSWCKTEKMNEVRLPLMAMLGKINTPGSRSLLLAYINGDSYDQTIKVAALRSAAKVESVTEEDLLPILDNADDYIVMECMQTLEAKGATHLKEIWEKCEHRDARIQAMYMRMEDPEGARPIPLAFTYFSKATDDYSKAHYVHAMGVSANNFPTVMNLFQQPEAYVVKYAAAEALVEMHHTDSWPKDKDFVAPALQAFRTGDIGVMAVMAAALREEKLTEEQKKEVTETLHPALSSLQLPREVETYNEIINTINTIGIMMIKQKTLEYNHPINWEKVATIPSGQQAKVITGKGEFIIDLKVDDAPGSVVNFVELVESGFFNDKYFHRVIPNFVIQGGCPRGDGMGGTDYTIRSEFALHNYSEGAVGLASSGRDTESCQWFVTHCPTPTLEGRYTIFGYVSNGMDVVKKIMVGDKIQRIELIKPAS